MNALRWLGWARAGWGGFGWRCPVQFVKYALIRACSYDLDLDYIDRDASSPHNLGEMGLFHGLCQLNQPCYLGFDSQTHARTPARKHTLTHERRTPPPNKQQIPATRPIRKKKRCRKNDSISLFREGRPPDDSRHPVREAASAGARAVADSSGRAC